MTQKKTAAKKRRQRNKVRQVAGGTASSPLVSMARAPAAYSAVSSKQKGTYPVMNAARGRCVVQNYEQISGIGGNAGFTANKFILNPGNTTAFPWLSTIALNYQKFRFTSFRAIWTPICSTTTTGSAYIYFQYDYDDTTPTTLAQVKASDSACSGNCWFGSALSQTSAFSRTMSDRTNIYVDFDTSRTSLPWYYVRPTGLLATLALSGTATGGNGTLALSGGVNNGGALYDPAAIPGFLFCGVDTTNPTSGTLGYLEIAYIVEFTNPIASSINN